jgi:indolepyruvate ferredoxin oxidoreductase
MNAPLPAHIARALETVTLDDKYSLDYGRAFMSGVQALVKLPMLQRLRDAQQGKNTAGFISGYRGSPLGGYDQALWKAKKYLQDKHIVFQPGVNEELAATALWGTQQLGFAPPTSRKYDGVFGIWYGKGPGVDRCADVFKHANLAGTTPWGGVLAVAGDDHVAKSSTAAHQSDHIFKACGLPVFFPASVQEILDLGLHALAMSRYAGVWAGMKTIQEIVESSATALIDPERVQIQLPTDFEMPSGGVHIRWPDAPLEQEARLMDYKWYAALAYVRANRLNHNVIEGKNDRLGLIASGKAYNDLRQALLDLGLDDATCQQLGIRLHKVGVVWPLEAQLTREFATGLREILVVEEKRQVIEYQLKEELYNWRADVRPNVLGKFNEVEGDDSGGPFHGRGGEWSMPNPSANTLLRANADLSPSLIAKALAARVKKLGVDADTARRIDARLAQIEAKERSLHVLEVKGAERTPWFCSGCPHNTSTKVPEGSRAMAGIGCHYMALWMDRATTGFTQMGGEGVPWVGQQPFVTDGHIFANLGDGTYFHSGLLAIRQSVAAGVNITYKVLYNDAVAMTGGQQIGERPEGHSVTQIAHSLMAEGVQKLVVVSDDTDKYFERNLPSAAPALHQLPDGVEVKHRDEMDAIQRELRAIAGTTAIIYDQTCATEKRRRRKRGLMQDPAKRVVINELVCEGCGDCGEQSNCVSVEPLETDFGRKRQINQSTCNKDYSCVKGFCPSFVTVEGGQLKKKSKADAKTNPFVLGDLPEPHVPAMHGAYGMVVAGVGGTGVITIGQLLGMAAHIEGKGIVTQDAAGLAQKGGSTWSHVLIANTQAEIATTRVALGQADLVLGCDPIVAASKETLLRMQAGRTRVALNAHAAPTAAFVHNGAWQNPAGRCAAAIAEAVGDANNVGQFNAEAMASKLMGDSIYTNPMMLGYAWQKGWIPLERASLLRAIELNATAVEANKTAFEWGRRAAHDWSAVERLLEPAQVIEFKKRESLEDIITKRVAFLTAYQNTSYAQQYQSFVAQVQAFEEKGASTQNIADNAKRSSLPLTEAVARNLFKLMAYKDEYEVARLHSDGAFQARIAQMFEGDYSVHHHLAPPLLAKKNAQGELQKRRYGAWMGRAFKLLAPLKFLRGTALDVFGYSEERRTERALISEYRASLEEVMQRAYGSGADPSAQWSAALEIARIPEQIKGFGHVKARNLAAARERWAHAQAQLRSGKAPAIAQQA